MIIQIDEKSEAPAHEKIESTLAAECQQFNVRYIPPVEWENSKQRYVRRRKVRNQIKSKDTVEDSLMADCHKLNVPYIPRVDGEKHNQCKVRRKKIRNEIRRIKNMSVDTAALQTEQPPLNSNVPETNMVVNETDIQTQELLSLHSNPKVVEAVKKCESGELCHTVKTCIVCMATKPIFHVTEAAIDSNQSEIITLRPWKIFNDGCCTRCHKERLIRQKKERRTAAKFSGLDSLDIDMGPIADGIRHNNMHFAEIPPYLKRFIDC